MSDIILKAMELTVMIVAALFMTKILPYAKQHIAHEKMDSFRNWVETAVAYAQQCFDDNAIKKDIVTKILRDIRDRERLPVTNDQIDILIEAAVKQIKLIENDVIFVGNNEYPWEEEGEYGTEG